MKQLKIGHILFHIQEMKKTGMTDEEICNTPIYLGDDDEINGIHTAFDVITLDTNDTYLTVRECIDLLNDSLHNKPLTHGKAILIC